MEELICEDVMKVNIDKTILSCSTILYFCKHQNCRNTHTLQYHSGDVLQVIENSLVSQHIHQLDLQQERHDRTAAAHHSEEGYTWRRSPLRRERENKKNDKSLSKKCQDLELFNDAIIPTDTI